MIILFVLLSFVNSIKGSDVPSTRNQVADEEGIRPGSWLVLLFYVPFSALTLMVWWQERHLARTKSCSINPQRFFSDAESGRAPADHVHLERWPLNGSSSSAALHESLLLSR